MTHDHERDRTAPTPGGALSETLPVVRHGIARIHRGPTMPSWVAALTCALLPSTASGQLTPVDIAPPNLAPGVKYGAAVAVDGDLAVVGAPKDSALGTLVGAVHIHRRQAGAWVHEAKLSFGAAGTQLGTSVATDGQLVATGCPAADVGAINAGVAYVFRPNGSSWTADAPISVPNPKSNDSLGASISILGDTLVLGAPTRSESAAGDGAVFVFRHDGTQWQFEAKLVSDAPQSSAFFGTAVHFAAPDDLWVTAIGKWPGSLHRFRKQGAAWVQVEKPPLPTDLPASPSSFGVSIDHRGNRLAVGSHGAAYLFRESGGAYAFEKQLLSPHYSIPQIAITARFGASVALTDDGLLVAAPGADVYVGSSQKTSVGRVHVFYRAGEAWFQGEPVLPPTPVGGLYFGTQVAVGPHGALLGALDEFGNLNQDAGAAYALEVGKLADAVRFGPECSTQQIFALGDPVAGSSFGIHLQGATVGAPAALLLAPAAATNSADSCGLLFGTPFVMLGPHAVAPPGSWTIWVTVPTTPSLVGTAAVSQFVGLEASGVLAFSGGLWFRIGL